MSAWSELWKSAGAATPPRGFAFAAYEVAPRQLLLVYGVHLKSNLGELTENVAMRRESVRQLQSHMKAMEEVYAKVGNVALVVGGDFNTSLDDPLMATDPSLRELMNGGLLWAWQNVPLGTRMTMPANKNFAATCFDHIFYRGLTLRRAWVGNCSPNSSDHRPVVATFNLAR
jgi:endonuclease/exonuclease/phosphatase (EEP) superfamily protein YafD